MLPTRPSLSLRACRPDWAERSYFATARSGPLCQPPRAVVRMHCKAEQTRYISSAPNFAFLPSSSDAPPQLHCKTRVDRRAQGVREQLVRPIAAEAPTDFPAIMESLEFI